MNRNLQFFAIFFFLFIFQNTYSQTNEDKLIDAADKNDTTTVLEMIKLKTNVNASDYNGITALMLAADKGNYEIVRILLAHKANPNQLPTYGKTSALLAAVKANNSEITDLLIKNGATIDFIDSQNHTALLYACAYGFPLCADILLQAGANPDLAPEKDSPLIVATFYRDTIIAQILINAGANVNLADRYGFTPLMIATQKDNITLINQLVKAGAKLNKKNNAGYNALDIAIMQGKTDVAKQLVDLGIEINNKKGSFTTRELAISRGQKEIDKILKKKGAVRSYAPNFNTFLATTALTFSNQDFFLNYEFTAAENRYGFDATAGYLIRPFRKKVLIPNGANSFYQFKEFRNSFYLQATKRFHFTRKENIERGIYAGAKESFFFGNYPGTSKKYNDLILSPVIGFYTRNDIFGFSMDYQYTKTKIYNLTPHQIKVAISFVWKQDFNSSNKYLKFD